MPVSRKELRGGKAFAAPLFGVIVLVACYWVLAEWHDLPVLISETWSAVHWPV
jgi:ABC-type Na+ efflux pump permease subunit